MKQKIIFFIGIILLIGIVVFASKKIFGSAPKQGDLRVESEPSANVFLDNKHIGRTPIGTTAYKVNPGEYSLKIVPDSSTVQYASWEGRITINSNALTYIKATIRESELATSVFMIWPEKIAGKKSEIVITTTPDSAMVTIDNESKGMTPTTIADLAPGKHTLTISSQGFETKQMEVRVTAGYRLVVASKLALTTTVPSTETEDIVVATPSGTIKPTGSIKPTVSPKVSGTPKPTSPQTILPDPTKPYALIKDTPTGFLRLRMEPATSATEVAKLNPGEKYSILDTKSGWFQIQYTSDTTGWISGTYATKVE